MTVFRIVCLFFAAVFGCAALTVGHSATGIATSGPAPTGNSLRQALTGNVTYFVRTDGNDACNGTVNSAGSSGNCAWLTWQHAISWIQANIDRGGFNVTIQAGESGATTFTFASPIICAAPFVGAGETILQGNSTWSSTGTLLDGSTSGNSISVQDGCKLSIRQFQIRAKLNSLECFGSGSRVYFSNILWTGSGVADIYASRHCQTEQLGSDIIRYFSNSRYHVHASHLGEFRNAGQTTTFGTGATYVQFAFASEGGVVVYTTAPSINLNAQVITGQRCKAEVNGIIEMASLGDKFLPGSLPCATVSGGQLVQ